MKLILVAKSILHQSNFVMVVPTHPPRILHDRIDSRAPDFLIQPDPALKRQDRNIQAQSFQALESVPDQSRTDSFVLMVGMHGYIVEHCDEEESASRHER